MALSLPSLHGEVAVLGGTKGARTESPTSGSDSQRSQRPAAEGDPRPHTDVVVSSARRALGYALDAACIGVILQQYLGKIFFSKEEKCPFQQKWCSVEKR